MQAEKKLSGNGEAELHEWIETVQHGKSEFARNRAMGKIMNRFMPYMNRAVMKMDPAGGEDALSAATEGLYHAVLKFNPDSGNRFFTYAYNCISGYVGMALRNGRLIRIPNSELKRLRKQENRDEYSMRTGFASLNDRLGDDDGTEFIDMVSYVEDYVIPDEEAEKKKEEEQAKRVSFIKATLEKNDRKNRENSVKARFDELTHEYDGKMYCMLHGILNEPQCTPKEIAAEMRSKGIPMSESTVRSRCNAITKLLIQEKNEADQMEKYRTCAMANSGGQYAPRPEDAGIGPLFRIMNPDGCLTT